VTGDAQDEATKPTREDQSDSKASTDVGEGGAADVVSSGAQVRRTIRRVLRGSLKALLFLLTLVPAWDFVLNEESSAPLAQQSRLTVAACLVVAVLLACLALALLGFVARLIARRRGRTRSWRQTATGFPVLGITFVVFVFAANGARTRQRDTLRGVTPNPYGTTLQREAANVDAQSWTASRGPVLDAAASSGRQYPRLLRMVTDSGNTAAVRRLAMSMHAAFAKDDAEWRALPKAPMSPLRRVDADGIEAMALAASAFADYVKALDSNAASGRPLTKDLAALVLLVKGDALLGHVGQEMHHLALTVKRLDRLYRLPGYGRRSGSPIGSSAFVGGSRWRTAATVVPGRCPSLPERVGSAV
jgi:hypothetical protein